MKALLLSLALCVPSARAAAPAAPAESRVILITTDGLRWREVFTGAERGLFDPKDETGGLAEFWRETPDERRKLLMPFLWSVIREKGVIMGNRERENRMRVTNGMNISYPGYQELLAGFPDPRIKSNDNAPNPNATVLEWLNGRPGFEGRVAAFGSWDRITGILNRARSRLPVLAPGEDINDEPLSERQKTINALRRDTPIRWEGEHFDSFTHYEALDYFERHDPRVLYVMYEETDEFAHDGIYAEYLRSARRVDDFVRRIWEKVQSTPGWKDRTTLILTTDHGRGEGKEWTSHKAKIPGSENIWLAAIGPGVAARGELSGGSEAAQAQVAATVAAAVGEDYRKAVPAAAPALDLAR